MRYTTIIIALAICIYLLIFQQTDLDILTYLNLQRNKSLDTCFIFITNSVTYVCIGAFILMLAMRQHLRFFTISFIITTALSLLLKFGIHRERPFLTHHFLEKLTSGGSPSFPSGHTTDAFFIATAISLISNKWYTTIPLYIWAILVGYSRICLGVHYPSDVLAGLALGSIVPLFIQHFPRFRQ